jgi:hypothetical protein
MSIQNIMKSVILTLQLEFDIAQVLDDKEKLRHLLADDFLSVGPEGSILGKEQWIAGVDQFSDKGSEGSEKHIRFNEQAAIVQHIQRNIMDGENGKDGMMLRVSQVWLNHGGKWLVASRLVSRTSAI